MALPLIPVPHLAPADGTAIKAAFQEGMDLLEPKTVVITAAERQQYGRINEKNKLKVNKVRELSQGFPALRAPGADYVELEKSHASRLVLEDLETFLVNALNRVRGTLALQESNTMNVVGKDYRHTRNQAEEGTPGFEAKFNDMRELWDTGGEVADDDVPE